MTLIRQMHPYGFRSGEWAMLRCIVPGPDRDTRRRAYGRPAYLVEFADSVTDFWVVGDPDAQYEFAEASEVYGPLADGPKR